jgi:circadian clock protein KaiC
MDRVRTGIEGLDQLLYGGILRGDAVLVAGAPGTGKTSLGMQYLYNGVTKFNEPGLLITFEEFPERIYRDAENFGWDFRVLQDENKLKVLFTSPEVLQQDIIRDQGFVGEMIAEMGATRVVVDSISNMKDGGEPGSRFRESVYGLVNALKAASLTAVLTSELSEEEEIGAGPEEFVADSLILLTRSYVMGQRMRYLEVIKSRGTPHIATPSLYFIGPGGLRIETPFQEPFYRFEEAVSTGIPQLDDLLGGGIPHGSFYLVEIDVDIHQDIFDASFAIEALEAGDRYVRIGGASDKHSRWRALMKSAGLEAKLEKGLKSGQVVFVDADCCAEKAADSTASRICAIMDELCPPDKEAGIRFQLDLGRLFAFLPPDQAAQAVLDLATCCRGLRSAVVGLVSPRGAPADHLEKLRATADGIVRVWSEGSYSFLQVVKTVNSARTPVYAIRQKPKPPFVEIIEP